MGIEKVCNLLIFLVPEGGVEPPWDCSRGILSPVRLPISPLRQAHIKGLASPPPQAKPVEPPPLALVVC